MASRKAKLSEMGLGRGGGVEGGYLMDNICATSGTLANAKFHAQICQF